MSKFGLQETSDAIGSSALPLSDRLAAFPSDQRRHAIDIAASDAAAAQHGFVSREGGEVATAQEHVHGRRRRAIPAAPTRHLAIRLTEGQYDRFVAYADRHKLTYQDALVKLLDVLGE